MSLVYSISKDKDYWGRKGGEPLEWVTRTEWEKIKSTFNLIRENDTIIFKGKDDGRGINAFYDFNPKTNHYHVQLTSYPEHYGSVYVDIWSNETSERLQKLLDIANSINAFLLKDHVKVIDQKFIDNLKIKENKIELTKEPVQEFTFFENATWLAVKCDDPKKVINYLKLKPIKEMDWDDAFNDYQNNPIIITPTIGDWVFITGDKVLDIIPETEDSQIPEEDRYFEEIKAMSKKFGNVQVYINWEKYSNLFYLKSLKGENVYSYSNSELGEEETGSRPKDIAKVDKNDIAAVCDKWSLNPLNFCNYPILEGAKVFVYYMPYKGLKL